MEHNPCLQAEEIEKQLENTTITNCTTMLKRKTGMSTLEPEFTGSSMLIRKKVSYINIRGLHVINVQLCNITTNEKLPGNQKEKKKLTRKKKGEL